ncbi:MAG: protein-L-isoaspartate(D-aspartate) O-methyltransferase [Pseudomonadota bacterium]
MKDGGSLATRKIRLIMGLRRAGIIDTRVLAAIERIPREAFVPRPFRDQAYEERTLPIGEGQTISQPQVVALMTQALEVKASHKVLEIGTGSGYQAAVLSRLARRIYSIERHRLLLAEAEQRFRELRLTNIHCRCADGNLGWPEQTAFDRIIVTAAAAAAPAALLAQLKDGGIMLAPIGPERGDQILVRYRREGNAVLEEPLGDVRFVPLLPGAVEVQGTAAQTGATASESQAGRSAAGPRRRTLA